MADKHPLEVLGSPPPVRAQFIAIGEFAISPCPHGGYWIYHQSGEGGRFKAEALEAVIKKFYGDNF